MMPHNMYHQDFETFFPALEQIARGHKSQWLLTSAQQYHNLGLPQVALALYAEIDTPESIQNIARHRRTSEHIAQIDLLADPRDEKGLDRMFQQFRDLITLPPEEARRQAWINAQAAASDPSLSGIIETDIASGRASSYLRIGNNEEALKQADRLSAFDDNPAALYIAAAVYAHQGRKEQVIDQLEKLSRLPQINQIKLPDFIYFDSIRDEKIFQTLRLGGIITGNIMDIPFATLTGAQLNALVQRADKMACGQYLSFIMLPIQGYVVHNMQLGIEHGNSHYFMNAEAAAKKAVEISGVNGDTAALLGFVYNKTNRHADAAQILLEQENYLLTNGKFELATALALSGDYQGAFIRLEQALDANPRLVQLMEHPAYVVLQKLSSQPGFGMLMIRTRAINNPQLS